MASIARLLSKTLEIPTLWWGIKSPTGTGPFPYQAHKLEQLCTNSPFRWTYWVQKHRQEEFTTTNALVQLLWATRIFIIENSVSKKTTGLSRQNLAISEKGKVRQEADVAASVWEWVKAALYGSIWIVRGVSDVSAEDSGYSSQHLTHPTANKPLRFQFSLDGLGFALYSVLTSELFWETQNWLQPSFFFASLSGFGKAGDIKMNVSAAGHEKTIPWAGRWALLCLPWFHCGWIHAGTGQAGGVGIPLCSLLGCSKRISTPHRVVCGQDKPQNDGGLQHSPSLWESHAPGSRIHSLIIRYLTNSLNKDHI